MNNAPAREARRERGSLCSGIAAARRIHAGIALPRHSGELVRKGNERLHERVVVVRKRRRVVEDDVTVLAVREVVVREVCSAHNDSVVEDVRLEVLHCSALRQASAVLARNPAHRAAQLRHEVEAHGGSGAVVPDERREHVGGRRLAATPAAQPAIVVEHHRCLQRRLRRHARAQRPHEPLLLLARAQVERREGHTPLRALDPVHKRAVELARRVQHPHLARVHAQAAVRPRERSTQTQHCSCGH